MTRPLALLAALTAPALAHHGQDFFVTLDTRVPDAGSGSLFLTTSWAKTSGADETEIDPGFLLGLGRGFAFGSSFQFSNGTPGSLGYAGVTPLLEWSTAIPGSSFRFGATASWHFADSSHSSSHASVHYHTIPDPGNGPGSNPDAPTGGSTSAHAHGGGSHSHDGIHRHGKDHFQTRLIGEWQAAEKTRVLVNLLAVGGGRDDIDFGYAVAVRQDLSHRLAAGLEVTGDFDTSGIHQAIAGLFYTPHHDITLRLGAGVGLGPGSKDFSLQSGVTWRF